jgi:hypothetical protein
VHNDREGSPLGGEYYQILNVFETLSALSRIALFLHYGLLYVEAVLARLGGDLRVLDTIDRRGAWALVQVLDEFLDRIVATLRFALDL